MAQRMESVAPPGGVMLSASTARLVEDAAVLGEPELVRIKGADTPVPRPAAAGHRRHGAQSAQRVDSGRSDVGTSTPSPAILDEAIGGAGCVVSVVGPPGIGKSRLVREAAAIARSAAACEVFTDLLRVARQPISRSMWWRGCCARRLGSSDLDDAGGARARARPRFPTPTPRIWLLLDDLLGIRRPGRVRCPTSLPMRGGGG